MSEKDSDDDLDDISNILGEAYEVKYLEKASESLKELLEYPFKDRSQEGKNDKRYNGAERVDVVKDKLSRIVRCPVKFLDVVNYIVDTRGKKPSIGLKFKQGTSTRYVHLLLDDIDEGWVYVDSRRMLQVRDVHKMEKIRDKVGLRKIAIIANQIGLPARHEVSRINEERGKIIDLHHFDTIHNHKLTDYF